MRWHEVPKGKSEADTEGEVTEIPRDCAEVSPKPNQPQSKYGFISRPYVNIKLRNYSNGFHLHHYLTYIMHYILEDNLTFFMKLVSCLQIFSLLIFRSATSGIILEITNI